MDALAQRLNFRYEVIESPNNVYGNCMEFNNGTVSCDGMVKMLVDQQVDMAITGFTITHSRAKYIDFTKPFMNLGITVLFRKPKPDPPSADVILGPPGQYCVGGHYNRVPGHKPGPSYYGTLHAL